MGTGSPSKKKRKGHFPLNVTDIQQISHSQDLVPQLVKTDVEQESELSMSVKREENGVEKEGKPESTTVVTGKTSKKRKTKEEKEAEAMPLRVRTQGLRMFVGAHVSAAKGQYIGLGITAEAYQLPARCL